MLSVPDRPGLGVQLDPGRLARYADADGAGVVMELSS